MKHVLDILLREVDSLNIPEQEKVVLYTSVLEKFPDFLDERSFSFVITKIFEHTESLEEWKQYDVIEKLLRNLSRHKKLMDRELISMIFSSFKLVKNAFLKYKMLTWLTEFFPEYHHLIKPSEIFEGKDDVYFTLLGLAHIMKFKRDKNTLSVIREDIDKIIYIVNPGDRERVVKNILDNLKFIEDKTHSKEIFEIIMEIINIIPKIGDSYRKYNAVQYILRAIRDSKILEENMIVKLLDALIKKIDKIETFLEYVSSSIKILKFEIELGVKHKNEKLLKNVLDNIYKIEDLKDKGATYSEALDTLLQIDKKFVDRLINVLENDLQMREKETERFLLIGYFLDHIKDTTLETIEKSFFDKMVNISDQINDTVYKVTLRIKILALVGKIIGQDAEMENYYKNILLMILNTLKNVKNEVYQERISEALGKTLSVLINNDLVIETLKKIKESEGVNYGNVIKNLILYA